MSIKLEEGCYCGEEIRSWENHLFKCNLTHYQPGALIQSHFHENDHLSLLVSGNYAEFSSSKVNLIENGNIIYRPTNYDHANNFLAKTGICFNVEFKRCWREQFDFDFQLPTSKTIYQTGKFPTIYRLLRYVISDTSHELYDDLIIDWLISAGRDIAHKTSLPWFQKIKIILDNEIEHFHSITSLSERVHVHPIYLARAFKKRSGLTIGEYQLKNKIQKSISLLFNTNLPINEVAFTAGFYDAAHFIKAFRAACHTSPAKFRALLKS